MYVSYTPISFTRISMRMQCEYKLCNKDKQFKEKKKNIHTLSSSNKTLLRVSNVLIICIYNPGGVGGGGDTHLGSGGSRGGVWGIRTPLRFLGKSFCTWKINLYLLRNKVSKFVWLDLSPEDDQNRGEDIKFQKKFSTKQPITIQWTS